MDISRVIIKPLLTEKSNLLKSCDPQTIAFIVDPKASKTQIMMAFASIYGVVPARVNTQIRKPAKVRTGTLKPGYSKLTKIAYVILPAGQSINVASEETQESAPAAKSEAVKKAESKGQLKEVESK